MFYEPALNNHGMAHSPFHALVAPRPIGWISSLSAAGVVNLAPYSFYNAVSGRPPFVMFASSTPKHSLDNAQASGEFVVNLASYNLREEMGKSSEDFGPEISEAEALDIAMAPSVKIGTPRVAGALAALECIYCKTVDLETHDGRPIAARIVIGEVVGVFIDDRLIANGRVDITRARPLSRLGYRDYAVVDQVFAMDYPTDKG